MPLMWPKHAHMGRIPLARIVLWLPEMPTDTHRLTPEELARWDRPGPRYTSYPTVPSWLELDASVVPQALSRIENPAQLYVHVPFCEQQCRFCGCNQVVAGRRDAGDRYLDQLDRQVERMPHFAVHRIHLGGGTPTWLSTEQLRRLARIVTRRAHPMPGCELSIEADPEITTFEQLRMLTSMGFRRLSLGVQSFDERVLQAVDRPQLGDRVGELVHFVRERGWTVNLDLMYGLPHQDPASFQETLEQVVRLRPERIAIFGYAHVPWLRRHQQKIDSATLPDVHARASCALLAQERLTDAGYVAIGFDHFALPTDPLVTQPRSRGFMGYSTRGGDMVGLGPSAISDVGGVMWQDEPMLGRWLKKLDDGERLDVRGWVRGAEDHLREAVIESLMCDLQVDIEAVEAFFDVDFGAHFEGALNDLLPLVDAGFVELDLAQLRVTERGRPLTRLVARAFDQAPRAARFSQTV